MRHPIDAVSAPHWRAFLGLPYAAGSTPELGPQGRPVGATDCQGVVLAYLRAQGVPAPDASLRGQAAFRWWDRVDGPPQPLDVVTSDPYEAGCASHVSVYVGEGMVLSAGRVLRSFAEPLWRVRRPLGVYRFRRRPGLSPPGAGEPPAGDPPAPGTLLFAEQHKAP